MAFAKISQVAYYVPSQVVTNDDLSKMMDTSDEWIVSRTGIKARHISQSEDTSDLASQVAVKLLEKAQLDPLDIDFIIVATITPDSMMPSTAARVQAFIKAENAFSFDLTAACSGFVFALSTAEKLIASGRYQKGLVIGAEVLSKTIDWSDRSTAVLFGDGAGGVLLEKSSSEYFMAESLHSDGSRGESLTSGKHAISSPFSDGKNRDNYFLEMDGRTIFDFAIRDVSQSISKLIEDSHVAIDSIDYYLLHQANIRILDKIAKKIGADREKFLANMMQYGNTSAASIPILLAEYVEKGILKLNGGQTILMTGFGGGLTWGSLIVKI
ncbi:beta-ketoacyl-ACP synthase III [Streptococcus macacae]|uniref:Beta-ketoacyl-[acyl-carrier-protein] synthase III n=1 Tax=Streptococcus macacae NCTC 11558 TaxID=764298 RepID=G5JY48_9STRE|nr:beta-ketoacyl-ACP synthase III [Streptococcus macacae]EHJ52792.1 3-oxoacyl-(acyl carrier protein) synthase III [Streptococcus macacae NCTC 11558]SUN77963.1 3-oxoacyl-ACP synthase [Streptococcus macacae NCTC 11558]